ncbi:MAG: chromosomal replication initiator protein DnaA [Anaerolineaceae bacterium]|nr:chromosomal replication initiator protein DnaA [Anaerolineaceae bacterium]
MKPLSPQQAWNIAFSQLEIQLDRASFTTWLRDAVFLGYADGVFRVGVPNTYASDMLQHRLYRTIWRVLSDIWGDTAELCFEVHKQERPLEMEAELPLFQLMQQQPEETPSAPLYQQVSRPQRPDLPESELNPRMTFDRFIVNSANRMTLEAALAVAEQPANIYNPLVIYGGVGLGKTHLMQSIAHACHARGRRAIYIPSEVFTNDLVDAIRHRATAMFREKYRSVDVLLVDDIQFIGGKESTQEEFFHTFNALYTFNKQIVLASDRPPGLLNTLEDRLRSRFEGGLVMDLQPPEFETRVAILRMWAEEREIDLPDSVCQMIADRARANIRELEGIFNQIVATTRFSPQPVTEDIAENLLESYHRPRRHITLRRVLDVTARHMNLMVDDLTGPRRTQKITQARQIAMYLAREVTYASLPQIGEVFGGRAHSTVLHSCNKIADEIQTDTHLRRLIQAMQEELVGALD